MKLKRACFAFGFLAMIIFAFLVFCHPSYSAFLYKKYIVRYDRGWDILCDPYVVKKNDWVIKLFKQKGEIARKDFPQFLRIFKRINPHIHDINRIRPGQHILIPLKKLTQAKQHEQPQDVVTIPFVTISNIPESFKSYSEIYKIKNGDCISILIARKYGAYGTKSYKQGIKILRMNNPDIKDLDRIYAGQTIIIPEPVIGKQQWHLSLFDNSEQNNKGMGLSGLSQNSENIPELSVSEDGEKKQKSSLSELASALDAKLFSKGVYYLPRPGNKDFELDLSRFPFIEFEDGNRMFFSIDNNNQESEFSIIKSFWKKVNIVPIKLNDPVERVFEAAFKPFAKDVSKKRLSFSDNGVGVEVRGDWIIDKIVDAGETVRNICITLIDNPEERTPPSISRYLDQNNIIIKEVLINRNTPVQKNKKPQHNNTAENVVTIDPSNRKIFVDNLITAMGYQYAPDVSISFPYAGIQVKAFSNLITKSNEGTFLVDFGELYDDARVAIEKTGLNIVQIKNEDSFRTITEKILSAADLSYSDDPTFLAANRPANRNTTLSIPGFLFTNKGGSKVLLSFIPLHYGIIQFLTNKGVKIIMIKLSEKYRLKPA